MAEVMHPYPVLLVGHTLKYEIECILKIFMPMQKFAFYYDKAAISETTHELAVLTLIQQADQTLFSVFVSYRGKQQQKTVQCARCTPEADKSFCEYQFSTMLYQILSEITGLRSPWGLLTGIRPIKKLQPLLRAGNSKEKIIQMLSERYWVSPEKLELVYQTAMVQEPLLTRTPKRTVSLYVSIPFCPTRCSYCSFVSHSVEQARSLIPDYVKYLCRELAVWGDLVQSLGLTIDTVYFGGGTPTAISTDQLEQVLEAVETHFDLSYLREYCVEAGRPDTITLEKMQMLRAHHVNRISVNPQTMQDAVLETIGRKHTTAQTVEAFRIARMAGFDNINMDLIAGLPGDTPEGFHDTLDQILGLQPDSITVHALTLKRAANLFATGATQVHNPVAQMVEESIHRLPTNGYAPYYMYRQKNTIDNQENVGYARPGKESLYNILIMDETQCIIGAGCGASTKIVEPSGKITRIHNYKFPYEYVRQFNQMMEKKEQARTLLECMDWGETS